MLTLSRCATFTGLIWPLRESRMLPREGLSSEFKDLGDMTRRWADAAFYQVNGDFMIGSRWYRSLY